MALLFLYLKLIAVSIVGMSFQLFFKSMSQQTTAKQAEVEYSFWGFVKNDRKAIIGTILTLCLFFLLFGEVINSIAQNASQELKPYFWGYILLSGKTIANIIIMGLCVTIAYTGQDAALRLLGRTSKELKDALETKVPNH